MNISTAAISIIVACRNSAATLAGCIQSILSQGIEGLEIVAVDGESTDGTLSLLERFEGVRIVSVPPRGPYDAMNAGIAFSTAGIVGILNSDDEYEAGCLRRVLDEFAAMGPEGGIVHGWVRRLREDGSERILKPESGLIRWLGFGLPTVHPATFVSRSVYDRIGDYNLSFPICADQEFVYRAIDRGVTLREIPEVLTMMRPGGLSSKCDPKPELAALSESRTGLARIASRFCWRRTEEVALFNGARDLDASMLFDRLFRRKRMERKGVPGAQGGSANRRNRRDADPANTTPK